MPSPRSFAVAVVLVTMGSGFWSVALPYALPRDASQQPSSAYDNELEKARQLLQRHDYFNALKAFQRANQIAGGTSPEAFLGMAQAMQGMKLYKNALDACQSAIDLAQENPLLLARSHKLKGQVFAAMGELRDAEAEFRAALAADPDSRVADLHYELGTVLIASHRDAEAIEELKKEIESRPNGTTADEARALISNPRRASEKYAPAFSFVSTDGKQISLETLRGRIVLLDFWELVRAMRAGPALGPEAAERSCERSVQPDWYQRRSRRRGVAIVHRQERDDLASVLGSRPPAPILVRDPGDSDLYPDRRRRRRAPPCGWRRLRPGAGAHRRDRQADQDGAHLVSPVASPRSSTEHRAWFSEPGQPILAGTADG
jgi:tetratricopeptide (TPR) repeat protein